MKKTYQIPTVAIVRVSPSRMIAASPLPTSEKPADENGGMLSKGGSMLWSDDDWTYDPDEE